ncbi:INO80 complex subunit B isoform X1 [Elephas maximus indicus]|uniref:INO80 complex subunit B isoform X1 n=1 Tax=Elephas maximus indicus TaxID=99487 RepID=UPI0021164CC8|nr:INO80 complex subunit B isoform X1 [Elephas maximus indicus]
MSKLWRRGSTSGAMEAPEPGEALELSLAGAHGHGVHKKKHKKHKKKHKKKHHQEEESGPMQPSPAKPQLKLKIKLGGQVLGTKSVPTFTVIPEGPRSPSPLMVVDNEEEPMEGVPLEQYRAWLDEDSNLSPPPLRDLAGGLGGQEEEEEQRWLDALEKGELDDNGDLKKEINERLLTARQISLLHLLRFLTLPGLCPLPASSAPEGAESAFPDAAAPYGWGLPGPCPDRGNAAEAGGKGAEAASAGCTAGRRAQEPDHRAPHQDCSAQRAGRPGSCSRRAAGRAVRGPGPYGALQQRCTGLHPVLSTWRSCPRCSVPAAIPIRPSSALLCPWVPPPAPLRLLPHRPGALQPAVLPHQPADAAGGSGWPGITSFGYLRQGPNADPAPCPLPPGFGVFPCSPTILNFIRCLGLYRIGVMGYEQTNPPYTHTPCPRCSLRRHLWPENGRRKTDQTAPGLFQWGLPGVVRSLASSRKYGPSQSGES